MCCKRRTQPLPTQRNPTPRTHPALLLQALAEELKVRPMDLVQRYRELGCVDVAVTATTPEGGRTRGYRVRTRCTPAAQLWQNGGGGDGGPRLKVPLCRWRVPAGLPSAPLAACRLLPLLTSEPLPPLPLPPPVGLWPPQITLMPPSAEEKTLGDYFPALKLGAKKR